MAIGYAWDVSTVDTYPTKSSKSDVIYNVHWKLTATDDTNKDASNVNISETVYGSQVLNTSDLSNFKAFADVTASDVQGWVETAIGSDEVTAIKTDLDANIAKIITPTSVQKTIGS